MDEAEDLIERLLAMAGALHEDASAVALVIGERSASERISAVMLTTGHLQVLLGAAAAVGRLAASAEY